MMTKTRRHKHGQERINNLAEIMTLDVKKKKSKSFIKYFFNSSEQRKKRLGRS